MIQGLARRIQLEPDELRHALVLGAILGSMTGSYTLVKTARDALFLSHMPAATLPFVFLGVGVLTLVASVLYGRATALRPTWEMLAVGSLVASVSLGVFVWLFHVESLHWVPVVFYLWVNVYGLLLLSQFWAFANSISDARTAKRIYGIVGGGGIFGGLVGGLLATQLARGNHLTSVLIAAALMQALPTPIVLRSVHGGVIPPPEEAAPTSASTSPWRYRYVRWIALAAMCSVLVTTLLDYVLKVEVQRRYSGSIAIAGFYGLFYTVVNVVALGFQLFATRWSLQRLGAGWSAAVLPGGLAIGTVATLLSPGFAPVLLTRVWDQTLRQSLNRAAVELFYFPLELGLRRRAKAAIEAGLERIGDAVAGLLILGLGMTIGANTFSINVLVAVLLSVWIVAWFGVRRGYVTELGRNLRRMNLGLRENMTSLREASVLREMVRLLDSPYERVVLHGVEMLEENAPALLARRIETLMAHPSPRVREQALLMAAKRPGGVPPESISKLMTDDDETVRLGALRAHLALGSAEAGTLDKFLESEDPRIRATALQCLAEFAPAEEDERVRCVVEKLLAEGTPEERALATEAIGRRTPPTRLHDMLVPLLGDPDLEVRRAALKAAGHVQRRDHVTALLEALGSRETRDAARQGLATLGDRVVGTLGDYLSDPSVPVDVRREVPYVLSDVHTQEAVNALMRFRERSDVQLGYRVLKAANKIRATSAQLEFPRELVTEDLVHDVRSDLFALVHYRSCPIGDTRSAERLLCLVLNERMDQALNRVFRRLQLLYPPANIHAAYRGVTSSDGRLRGNALEYLENALDTEHRTLVLPLVGDTSDEERLVIAAERFQIQYENYTQSLDAMLQAEDAWLRTCALYVVGSRREQALKQRVEDNLRSTDERVRETAGWAQAALAAG